MTSSPWCVNVVHRVLTVVLGVYCVVHTPFPWPTCQSRVVAYVKDEKAADGWDVYLDYTCIGAARTGRLLLSTVMLLHSFPTISNVSRRSGSMYGTSSICGGVGECSLSALDSVKTAGA